MAPAEPLVGNKLREQGLIDSIKVVRQRTKPEPEPDNYKTEIVILVFNARSIERVRIHSPRAFERSRTVRVKLEY